MGPTSCEAIVMQMCERFGHLATDWLGLRHAMEVSSMLTVAISAESHCFVSAPPIDG